MPILYTSLAEIKSFNPCASGWRDILSGRGKTAADDELFPLIECVDSNSISDVCWLLGKRKVEVHICVRFARMCADSVAHLKNVRAAYAAVAAAAAAADAVAAAADAVAAAADAVAAAAAAADAVAAADAARQEQREKNKQFLIQAITDYQTAT